MARFWLRRGAKYGATKTIRNGIKYDSRAEANRGQMLEIMQGGKAISDLKRQVQFELQPHFMHNGKMERAINYVADFVYIQDGKTIVEDVKGMKTKEYLIKRKMFLYKYGGKYEFREIETAKKNRRQHGRTEF